MEMLKQFKLASSQSGSRTIGCAVKQFYGVGPVSPSGQQAVHEAAVCPGGTLEKALPAG